MDQSIKKYPKFDKDLLSLASKKILRYGFQHVRYTLRGCLFIIKEKNTAILMDHLICDVRYPYDYSEYTKEQNSLMHQYNKLFRFSLDSSQELDEIIQLLDRFFNGDFNEDKISINGENRELQEVDTTLPEAWFEQIFIDCFGRKKLDRVMREFPVIDINGSTRWVDYYIRRNDFDIAVEKNGERYHHPLIIGTKKYKSQLLKQNSLMAYGAKVFRWSLQGMKFTDNFSEEMQLFFGNPDNFLLSQKVSISRQFKLFHHQENAIEGLKKERKKGKIAFLVS